MSEVKRYPQTWGCKAVTQISKEGVVDVIASVYDIVDLAGERVKSYAFDKTIAENKMPKVCMSHDWNQVIGKVLELKSLAPNDPLLPDEIKEFGGLWARLQLSTKTQAGQETFALIEDGMIDEYSIGYEVKADNWVDGIRDLEELYLFEISPVLLGCNTETSTLATKNMTFDQKQTSVNALLDGLVEQARIHLELREKAGRPINAQRWNQLLQFADGIEEQVKLLRGLLAETDPTQYTAKGIDPRVYLKMKQLKGEM